MNCAAGRCSLFRRAQTQSWLEHDHRRRNAEDVNHALKSRNESGFQIPARLKPLYEQAVAGTVRGTGFRCFYIRSYRNPEKIAPVGYFGLDAISSNGDFVYEKTYWHRYDACLS
jgi:hypothetical protein